MTRGGAATGGTARKGPKTRGGGAAAGAEVVGQQLEVVGQQLCSS
jgi:hypothetical protein